MRGTEDIVEMILKLAETIGRRRRDCPTRPLEEIVHDCMAGVRRHALRDGEWGPDKATEIAEFDDALKALCLRSSSHCLGGRVGHAAAFADEMRRKGIEGEREIIRRVRPVPSPRSR